jgi:hypothetical protein
MFSRLLQAEAIELPPKTELFHGFLSPVSPVSPGF